MRPGGRDGGIQTGKAMLLIVVVVVIGWLVLHHTSSSPTASGATSTTARSRTSQTVAHSTTTTTTVPPTHVKLQVLNGTSTPHLATEWSDKLHSSPGYDTLVPNDTTSNVTESVIYIISPGYQAEADALAATVGLSPSRIDPTIPAPTSAPIPASVRTSANLVLVIGPDLASSA